jgi:nucleotidyltransferase/DNA polymerase involved in DNA repair
MITCVRLPHFAAHLEERAHPELRGKAVVLVEPVRQPPQVYAVSPKAAQAGIRPGMPLAQARARCDQLHVQPAVPSRYQDTFETLLEALTTFTPQVEPEDSLELRADARRSTSSAFLRLSQLDDYPTPTCYLDLGKLKPDAVQDLAEHIHQHIQAQVDLPAKLGVASGKFPARVAATAVNAGELLLIPSGQEAAFLDGFTVALLPVDGETLRQLDLLGLYTLGQLAALPVSALLDRFGKQGRIMHRLASGRDTSPVAAYVPPVVERLRRAWDGPLVEWERLEVVLNDMVAEAAAHLLDTGHTIRQITLLLSQEDGATLERAVVLRQPSANVRHIRDTVHEMGRSLPVAGGVVAAELVLSDIAPAVPTQLSLFERDAVPQAHLNSVLKDLIARYGSEFFYWMRAADPDARLPERRFRWEKAGPG